MSVSIGDGLDQLVDLLGVAHVAGDEPLVSVVGRRPPARHHRRAGRREPLVNRVTDPARPAGDEHDLTGEVEGVVHARIPTTVRTRVITHSIDGDGIADVVMDNPPVNALPVAGWFELADTVTALGR